MWRGWLGVLLVWSFSSGCLQPQSVQCDDRVCPRDTTCHPQLGCVAPSQVTACDGIVDGDSCEFSSSITGVCADHVCVPRSCGNGLREPEAGEDCDTPDIGGATCETQGYYGGSLGCTPACRFDTSACAGICGDGTADTSSGEACDGSDLGGKSCTDYGFYGGTLKCLPNCQPNVVMCDGLCGDGAKDLTETCDGNDFGTQACTSLGFYTGQLACNATCDGIATSGCSGTCGDNTKNGPEVCDNADLGGFACQSFGFYGGTVGCASDCTSVVKTACAGYCGDSTINGNELCDGSKQSTSCTAFGADAGSFGCDGFCQRSFDRCFYGDAWRASSSPTSSAIFDMVALSSDEIWAVGTSGLVMRGNGQQWTTLATGTFQTLHGVWPRTSTDVWVVGGQGTILRYNGTSWTSYTSGTNELLTAVWGTGPSDVWATGLVGKILHFNGTSWTPVLATSPYELWDVWGTATNDVWFVGRDTTISSQGAVLLHWNGGSLSVPVKFPSAISFEAIWGSSSTEIWATGTGTIAHYDGSWSIVSTPVTDFLRDLRGTSANDIWGVGEQGAIAHYDGVSWSYATSTIDTALYAVAPFSRGDAWAGGASGVIGRWVGTGWKTVASNTTAEMQDVFGITANDVWAVGDSGTATHWDGTAWTAMSTGVIGTLYGVWGSASDDVWAVGGGASAGKIAHWTNGSWSPLLTGAALFGIHGADANHVWAVGENGTIMFWNGSGWTAQTSNTTSTLWTVWAISPTDVWAAGDFPNSGVNAGKGAVHFDGVSWTPVYTGFRSFRALWGSASTDIWATGMGELYHWSGSFWDTVSQPSSAFFQAIWGISHDDIFTSSDVLHWDGASWTQVIEPPSFTRGLWGSATDDLWAVGPANEVYHWGGGIPQLPGGACAGPVPLYCGTTVTGSNAGAAPPSTTYACNPRTPTGGEVAYRFENPVTGSVTFTLTPFGGDLDLILLDGASDTTCAPDQCLTMSQTAGTGTEQIVRTVVQGDVLHLLIEGFAGISTGYKLQVTCTKQ
jgi:hypothetical protein